MCEWRISDVQMEVGITDVQISNVQMKIKLYNAVMLSEVSGFGQSVVCNYRPKQYKKIMPIVTNYRHSKFEVGGFGSVK